MEDWGLQAVITAKEENGQNYFKSFGPKKEYDEALIFSFSHDFFDSHEIASTNTMRASVIENELDQIYKPFYPIFKTALQLQTIRHENSSNNLQKVKQEIKNTSCGPPFSASSHLLHVPKLKKRKNQHKKVVVQVTADALSSDLWGWRKYGQKPIKGSPSPRSYYKCSSSKQCSARRQMDQSCSGPDIYLVTYTGEHNHPQPTRRNSLAGVNRKTIKNATKSAFSDSCCKSVVKTLTLPFCSRATLSPSSIDEEVLEQPILIKQDNYNFKNQKLEMMEGMEENDFVITETIFSDEIFVGLEDFGGFNSKAYSSPLV